MGQAAAVAIPAAISVFGAMGGGKGKKSASPELPAFLRPLFGGLEGGLLQGLAGQGQGFQGGFSKRFGDIGRAGIASLGEFLGGPAHTDRLNILQDIGRSGGLDPAALGLAREQLRPIQALAEADFTRSARSADAARGNLFSTGSVEKETTGLSRLRAAGESDIIQTALSTVPNRLAAAQGLGEVPGGISLALQAEAAQRAPEEAGLGRRIADFQRTDPISFLERTIGALGAGGGAAQQPTFGPSKFETLGATGGAIAPAFSGKGKE